jgi:hypothetical protein
MKFEESQVFNIQGALRGMRNPLSSWKHIDSVFGIADYRTIDETLETVYPEGEDITFSSWENNIIFNEDSNIADFGVIGPKDLNLAQRLIKAGPEHRKFMRQIFVSVDITAPLYWWKEADTYKISTVANSTSTMHKLASFPITLECFEIDDYDKEIEDEYMLPIVDKCEKLRLKYIETQDKRYWKALIRLLPESWLQKRTWTANYEVLRNMYFQRHFHKLSEWNAFATWVESLPYAKELILYNG